MSDYLGDFAAGATVRKFFNTTRNSDDAPVTLAGSPAVAVYIDGSTAEITTGATLTVDFDGRTGLHQVAVDTTTGYAAGKDYEVVLTAGTASGTSVAGVTLAKFSIANRSTPAAGSGIGALANDGSAVLNLKSLNVVNSAGDAVVMQSTGGGGRGLLVAGLAAGLQVGASDGAGVNIYAGTNGHGIQVVGGASAGNAGISATPGGASGHGLYLAGAGDGSALWLDGSATGATLLVAGPFTSGPAVSVAAVNGHAILAAAGTQGDGFRGVGAGTGVGFASTPDASGFGSGGGGSGTVDANLVSIDGLTTADGAAVLRLKRLVIVNDTYPAALWVTNSAGDAIYAHGAQGNGMTLSGDYSGLYCYGSDASAHGIDIYGGQGGVGVDIEGNQGPALKVVAQDSDAVSIDASWAGYRDVALLGSGDVLGNLAGLIDGLSPAGLATLFGVDSGATFADAVAGSPVKEIAANASPADYQQRGVAVTLPTLPPVTLAADGLDAISVADPGAPAGHTTLGRMLVALYRRFYGKVGKTPTAITTYADNGTTVNATQPVTDDGTGTQTVGKAT